MDKELRVAVNERIEQLEKEVDYWKTRAEAMEDEAAYQEGQHLKMRQAMETVLEILEEEE
jgi:hypothetical protein